MTVGIFPARNLMLAAPLSQRSRSFQHGDASFVTISHTSVSTVHTASRRLSDARSIIDTTATRRADRCNYRVYRPTTLSTLQTSRLPRPISDTRSVMEIVTFMNYTHMFSRCVSVCMVIWVTASEMRYRRRVWRK